MSMALSLSPLLLLVKLTAIVLILNRVMRPKVHVSMAFVNLFTQRILVLLLTHAAHTRHAKMVFVRVPSILERPALVATVSLMHLVGVPRAIHALVVTVIPYFLLSAMDNH
jgi:hypothetical protein